MPYRIEFFENGGWSYFARVFSSLDAAKEGWNRSYSQHPDARFRAHRFVRVQDHVVYDASGPSYSDFTRIQEEEEEAKERAARFVRDVDANRR